MTKTMSRTNPCLGCYFQDIAKLSPLTPAEEIKLARRIRKGDEEALERLIKANLRFVVTVAKKYQNRGLPLDDLINEGNLGLITAAKRFDESRGFKFISYAVWWIRQAIITALAQQRRVVRLPLNRVAALNKIGKALGNFEQEFQREPSAIEIAEDLEMTSFEVSDTLKVSGNHLSLDAPLGGGDNNRLVDLIQDNRQPSPDDFLVEESLGIELKSALTTLSAREAEVVELYFGLGRERPLTLGAIGERFNVSRERIRQIKDKAIRRLRHTSRSRRLRSYLH